MKTETALAKYIRQEIEQRRVSMEDFADEVGVARTTILRILSGKIPRQATMIKLSYALHVDIRTLSALIAPEASHEFRPEILVLAERISQLPPQAQEFVDTMIRGILLEQERNRVNRNHVRSRKHR